VTFAAFDAQAPVTRVIDLLLTILQPVFWVALCLGFVLAGAHFLTMLATRWGERRVSGKALFFSLAVHLSIGCGIIALIPEYRHRLLQFIEPEQQEPIRIRTVIYEADQETPEDPSGNTPIWDQLAKADVEDPTRFDKTTQAFEPDTAPEPQPEEVELEQRMLPDVDMTMQRPTALPQQEQSAPEALQEQAVLPLEVEAPQTMANEDQSVPSTTPERASVDAPNPVEESVERQQRQGAVDRPRSEYAPLPDVASIEARNEQIAQLERRQNEEIRRREGPAPAQLQTD